LEGQLRLFVLQEARGAELIQKAARLAPYDAPTCLVAGELAAREGRLAEAQGLLERAVQLQPRYFREVADLYLAELSRPDLARALAGTDHNRLSELANAMNGVPRYADEVKSLRAAAEASLRERVADNTADSNELVSLARIERERGDSSAAVDLYRKALSGQYHQVEWRLELANLLAQTGELDQAIHEVRIALRLRPRHGSAVKLLEELTTKAEDARARSTR
jgi:tetratricopeptide (TPR) repeat protein